MEKMRVAAVCGFGVGSSVILKIKLAEVLQGFAIQAEVITADLTTASSEQVDLIVTSKEIYAQLEGKVKVPIVQVSNFLDTNEIKEKLREVLPRETA